MTGPAPRRIALGLLLRIDTQGAYANVVVPATLAACDLGERDRALVTKLVYGVTRRRRALDHVIDAFLVHPPPPVARAALRLGAYQLTELGIAPYAAVSTTVNASPRRFRGLVNAVLRRVCDSETSETVWPDEPTRLSYPDWIVERLSTDLGSAEASESLEAMNRPAPVHRRSDGYVQDLSSQLVVDSLDVPEGGLVADVCAAPGGKATALAARGAIVVACDSHLGRLGRMVRNRDALGASTVLAIAADSRRLPLRARRFDVVLVDAPCSGLGALRRRPDARWRIAPAAVSRLARLQHELLNAAVPLLRPGGLLAYSVCTLTAAETTDVADRLSSRSDLEPVVSLPSPWRQHGTGGIVLPDDQYDGMALFCWRNV